MPILPLQDHQRWNPVDRLRLPTHNFVEEETQGMIATMHRRRNEHQLVPKIAVDKGTISLANLKVIEHCQRHRAAIQECATGAQETQKEGTRQDCRFLIL